MCEPSPWPACLEMTSSRADECLCGASFFAMISYQKKEAEQLCIGGTAAPAALVLRRVTGFICPVLQHVPWDGAFRGSALCQRHCPSGRSLGTSARRSCLLEERAMLPFVGGGLTAPPEVRRRWGMQEPVCLPARPCAPARRNALVSWHYLHTTSLML